MDIKIAFFDIDGTLIDPAVKKISQKTALALTELRRRGIKTCVVTGRPTASMPDFGELVFDAFAGFNGALCYTPKQIIYSNPIPRREVEKLLENAAALGRPVSVAVKDRLSANGIDKDLADYYAVPGLTLTVDPNFAQACQEPVYQIMVGYRPEERAALVQGVQGVKLALSWERAIDIIPETAGKSAGIRSILNYYALQPSQAIAFGDSYNDLEMFGCVGHSVAMGNAVQELKAIAGEVCPPVWQDGIYQYCLAKGLIG